MQDIMDVVQRVVCSRTSSGWKIFLAHRRVYQQGTGVYGYGWGFGAHGYVVVTPSRWTTAYRAMDGLKDLKFFMKYYLIVGEASGDGMRLI